MFDIFTADSTELFLMFHISQPTRDLYDLQQPYLTYYMSHYIVYNVYHVIQRSLVHKIVMFNVQISI